MEFIVPSVVKEYLDCIIQTNKTIEFHNNKPYGLLGDKQRVFIYVQSSGGDIPWLLKSALTKGLNYSAGHYEIHRHKYVFWSF